jgi:cytochrome c peroxidase
MQVPRRGDEAPMNVSRAAGLLLFLAFLLGEVTAPLSADPAEFASFLFPNAKGQSEVIIPWSHLDPNNTDATKIVLLPDHPFLLTGSNGRSCATCHDPNKNFGLNPFEIREIFNSTGGMHPLFDNVDGVNCPGALPGTTEERAAASSLLIEEGLIAVPLTVPGNAEFTIQLINDPVGCAPPEHNAILVYRRIPQLVNLAFVAEIMSDGRESLQGTSIFDDLKRQARRAHREHALADNDLTDVQAAQIAELELGTFARQRHSIVAGDLSEGNPALPSLPALAQQFVIGTSGTFTLFGAFVGPPSLDPVVDARRRLAEGEALFNTRGCGNCHNTANVGSRSSRIQTAPLGASEPALNPKLPVYRMTRITTGEIFETTDPGKAMATGRWRDRGHKRVTQLRNLAAKTHYFSNGSRAGCASLVQFYDTRQNMRLTTSQKASLALFCDSL